MAEQEFLFGQELTLDRATAPGTSPMPTDIRGVVSEAPGVMRARGALASVVSSSIEGYELLGYDETGLASFIKQEAHPSTGKPVFTLALLRDGTLSVGTSRASGFDDYPDEIFAYHIPGVGAHVDHKNGHFLVVDRGGTVQDGPALTFPVNSVAAVTGSGDLEDALWHVLIIPHFATASGKYVCGFPSLAVNSEQTLVGQVLEFTAGAHTLGDSFKVDFYLREADTPSPFVLAATLGSGETLTITDFPVGLELDVSIGRQSSGVDAGSYLSNILINVFRGQPVLYRGRLWGRPAPAVMLDDFDSSTVETEWAINNWHNLGGRTLFFSSAHYLNLAPPENYIANLNVPGSLEVTGLAATETGIFVFGENGTGLIYGDPTLALTGRIENFGQRPVDAGLGHRDQQPPALLGGTAFHVWRGRVYVIDGNSSTEISTRIYNADDEFVAVVADNVNKLLLCLTENSNVFVYDAVQRMWLGDSASDGIGATSETVQMIVPNATHGAVYVHFNPAGGAENTVFEAYGTASFEDMVFDFDDFSMGDRFRRDLWVALEVFIENTTGTPTLSFDTESGDSVTLGTVNGRRRDEGDLWDFVFPWGIACRMGDWALTIPSDGTTRAYLPWKFRYIDREDSRWGKDDEAP